MPYLSSKRSSSSSQLLAILKPRADRFQSKLGMSAIAEPQIEVNGDHILLPLGVASTRVNATAMPTNISSHLKDFSGGLLRLLSIFVEAANDR